MAAIKLEKIVRFERNAYRHRDLLKEWQQWSLYFDMRVLRKYFLADEKSN